MILDWFRKSPRGNWAVAERYPTRTSCDKVITSINLYDLLILAIL